MARARSVPETWIKWTANPQHIIEALITNHPLVAQTVKKLPTVQEIWVQSLGQENPLEKGMAINSSILA